MIKININVTKINKDRIVAGKKLGPDGKPLGKYLGLVLFENRDGVDQYGNHGFVKEDVSQADREAGVQGTIIGNWKDTSRTQQSAAAPARKPTPPKDPDLDPDQEDDIPF
jgi:hypothetical protein